MPEMSGIEVCRKLKADPQLRLIPIILVTAHDPQRGHCRGPQRRRRRLYNQAGYPRGLVGAAAVGLADQEHLRRVGCQQRATACEMAERAKAEEELRQRRSWNWWASWRAASPTSSTICSRPSKATRPMPWKVFRPRRGRYQDLQQVLKASSRASTLTRQLLGFSRRRALEKKHVDPNRVVADLAKMIRPLIGTSIQLEMRAGRRKSGLSAPTRASCSRPY